MNDIRVTYVGIIAFLSNIVVAIGGLIFTILTTRILSPDDLGLLVLISSLLGYSLILEPIPSYWLIRKIARGYKLGKTGIVFSSALSGGSLIIYAGLVIFVSATLDVDVIILIIAALLVPTGFLKSTINSMSLGCRPQAVSYSIMISSTAKVPIVILLVVGLHMGIVGFLVVTVIENIVSIGVMLLLLRPKNIMGVFDKQFIKFMLSMSWLSLYNTVNRVIYSLDVLIFPVLTNSLVGVAYWGIAVTMGRFIIYAGSISQGLYSKILATNDLAYTVNNLRYVLLISIPILALIISLVEPALHILNPIYAHISLPVILYSFHMLVFFIFNIFITTLDGKDQMDTYDTIKFKKYLKSNLFKTSTIQVVNSVLYISTLVVLLTVGAYGTTDLELVTGWTITTLVFSVIFAIYTYIILRKKYSMGFPYISMIKYSIASIPTIFITNYLLKYIFTYSDSIYTSVLELLCIIIIGFSIYFMIGVVIDKHCKELLQNVIKEISKIKNSN